MSTADQQPSLVRPEYGPTLPALLRARFGLSPRATNALIAAVIAAVLAVGVVIAVSDGKRHLVLRGDPVFNVTYDPDDVRRVAARPGELLRLEGRAGRVAAAIVVKPLELPPYRGDIPRGLLPVFAEGYSDRLRASLPQYRRRDEGKARFGEAAGYQLTYRSGPPGRRTFSRDVMLVLDEGTVRDRLVVRLDRTYSGRVGARGQAVVDAMQSAFRSLRFGEDPP